MDQRDLRSPPVRRGYRILVTVTVRPGESLPMFGPALIALDPNGRRDLRGSWCSTPIPSADAGV